MSASCQVETPTRPTPQSTLTHQDRGDLGHGASRSPDGSMVHGHRHGGVPTSQRKSSPPHCDCCSDMEAPVACVARQCTFDAIMPLLRTLLRPAEAPSLWLCSSCVGYTCLPWNMVSGSQPLTLRAQIMARQMHCRVIRHLSSTCRSRRPQWMRRTSLMICTSSSWRNLMIWAAMATCVFGFLWAGEVCCPSASDYDPTWHLCVSDMALDSHLAPTRLFITIKASKTDPFRQGVTITLGKTGQQLCPMSAILLYVAMRGDDPGPLFRFADGSFLMRGKFVSEVRQRLMAAKIDPAPYSGHSFRIGAATTAARAGMDATMIQTLGRWKSSACHLYIKFP